MTSRIRSLKAKGVQSGFLKKNTKGMQQLHVWVGKLHK